MTDNPTPTSTDRTVLYVTIGDSHELLDEQADNIAAAPPPELPFE